MAEAIRGGIVINEIHAQPVAGAAGFDTDGNGTAAATDEYLEFLNTSGSAIDLSGLQLWDPGSGNWFTFPSGSVVAPGGFALVVTGVQTGGALPAVPAGSLAFDAGRASAVLNNPGDNVYVVDPVANSFISAAYGNWPLMDPTDPTTWGVATGSTGGLASFPSGATQIGAGESFGPILPGDSIQRRPDGADTFDNNGGETPGGTNLCFTTGTLIGTPNGPRRIEDLRPGDILLTADGDTARLTWVGMKRLSLQHLRRAAHLWPVTFQSGSLGPGIPARRLTLSPLHRVLVSGPLLDLWGMNDLLVTARSLVGLAGVEQPTPRAGVTYVHLMCDRHVVLLAEGAAAESLYFGAVTRDSLPPDCVTEIIGLFPELDLSLAPATARPFARGQAGRDLSMLVRHQSHPLQAPIS